jgi:hypothetical protein
MLHIKYRCPEEDGGCGHEWEDIWECACDTTCPHCGLKDITALNYEEIGEDNDGK